MSSRSNVPLRRIYQTEEELKAILLQDERSCVGVCGKMFAYLLQ